MASQVPSIALEREFSDVEEWERDFQESTQNLNAQNVTELTSLIQNLDASSKFKAALICAAGMSVDPAMSVCANSTWP